MKMYEYGYISERLFDVFLEIIPIYFGNVDYNFYLSDMV